MSLSLFIGPMCSGKTSKLLELYQEETKEGKKCIMITPDMDSRTKSTGKWTHDGKTFNGDVIWSDRIQTENITHIAKTYDVFLINEGQFIKDIYEGILLLTDQLQKKVYVSGLDGDFNRQPFGDFLRIIPLCDSVTKLKARCEVCGKEAIFSKRMICDENKIVIGGKELYQPRCREHYLMN